MAVEYRWVPVEVPSKPRLDSQGRRLATIHTYNRERKLPPHRGSGSAYSRVPMLRLRGDWLRQAGFPRGQDVAVEVEEGRLVILAL